MRDAPVGDVGLNKTKHLLGRLRDLNKHTIVDLEEAEELEDFAGLGSNVVDTGGDRLRPTSTIVSMKRLTPGYGRQSKPSPGQGRRSRRQHAQPASDGSPPSPRRGTPSHKIPRA